MNSVVTSDLNSKSLLASQEIRESSARSYPRRLPLAIKKAEGVYVTDKEQIDDVLESFYESIKIAEAHFGLR